MPRLAEVFGAGDVRLLRLETATGLLVLLCLFLAVLLLWQRLSGLPVCYGTAAVAPGLVMPNEVPEAHVRALSEQVVLILYNITSETAEAAHKRVAQLLHPRLLHVFNARAARERELMQRHALSTQLSIRQTIVGRSGVRQAARIDAIRRVYAGTLPIRDEELGAVLQFTKVQPSPLNPWGLSLVSLEFTQPLRAETE